MNTNSSEIPQQSSLLWRIHKDGREALIGGTMHVPFDGYELICRHFIHALEQFGTTRYLGETNLDDMMQQRPSLATRSLSSLWTPAQYRRLRRKLLTVLKVDLNAYEHLPPMMLTSAISAMLLQVQGASIDEVLWQEAKQLNLKPDGLEPFDVQLSIYNAIPVDYQYLVLKRLLKNLTHSRRSLLDMVEMYRNGKIHALYQSGRRSLGPIRQLMLHKRNQHMVTRINDLVLNHDERHVITVGAAHLSGEIGILHLLSKEGFKKERYPVSHH